ncbi:unnamed protein product [Orchesella dallaii]|uniref:GB1/RHD3-type G domain-containing protein n=1 Tax=Orchesella dallaii TaxID=48710 RepID=A0ABP1R7W2_9HEXA
MSNVSEKNEQLQKSSGSVTILELVDGKQSGNGRLKVDISHLLRMLSQIGSRPVVIISINGKQRSGKSFLVNQFIRYLKYSDKEENWLDKALDSGFEWRGDLQRVTSGIKIWHEPLYVKVGGSEIAVIIMDTQGLHDQKTGVQENAIIFGMSVLLSSVFIFNEKNVADDSLQYLCSFLEFAKYATGDSGSKDILMFQKLILLMRDFHADGFAYGYYDDTNCPPRQTVNLKNMIFELTSDMHREARDTRSSIDACFEKVCVYAMCGPGNRFPNKYKDSREWDSDFKASVVDFVITVLNPDYIKSSTKQVFGQEITGERLKGYVTKWAQLIQEAEGMIHFQTVFESTAEMFYINKIEEGCSEYKNKMTTHLEGNQTGSSDLHTFHEVLVVNIVAEFSSGKVLGGASMLAKYKKILLQRLNGLKEGFVRVNDANYAAEQKRLLAEKESVEAQFLALQQKHQTIKQLAISTAERRYQKSLSKLRAAQERVQRSRKGRIFYGVEVQKLQQVVQDAELQLNVARNA